MILTLFLSEVPARDAAFDRLACKHGVRNYRTPSELGPGKGENSLLFNGTRTRPGMSCFDYELPAIQVLRQSHQKQGIIEGRQIDMKLLDRVSHRREMPSKPVRASTSPEGSYAKVWPPCRGSSNSKKNREKVVKEKISESLDKNGNPTKDTLQKAESVC